MIKLACDKGTQPKLVEILECVYVTCTKYVEKTLLLMTANWLPFPNVIFENFGILYIFHNHVPNFFCHKYEKIASTMNNKQK